MLASSEQVTPEIEVNQEVEDAQQAVDEILTGDFLYVPEHVEGFLLALINADELPPGTMKHDMRDFIRQILVTQVAIRKQHFAVAVRDTRIIHMQLQGINSEAIVEAIDGGKWDAMDRNTRSNHRRAYEETQTNVVRKLQTFSDFSTLATTAMIEAYIAGNTQVVPVPLTLSPRRYESKQVSKSTIETADQKRLRDRLQHALAASLNSDERILLSRYLLGEINEVENVPQTKKVLTTLFNSYLAALVMPQQYYKSSRLQSAASFYPDDGVLISRMTDYEEGLYYHNYERERLVNPARDEQQLQDSIIAVVGRIAFRLDSEVEAAKPLEPVGFTSIISKS